MSEATRARRTLAGGILVLTGAAILARRDAPPRAEMSVFDAVNALPEPLHAAVWPVMQLGALAAVPVAAAALEVTNHRVLARRAAVSGTITWALAKAVKRAIRRPRPGALASDTRIRGRAASGEGFVSGHAGVAAALAASALPALPGWGVGLAALAATVGTARIYVGAHLPLDVVGGTALGLAVHSAVVLALPARP